MVIHADETVVQENKESDRAAAAEARTWAYVSSKQAERQIRYFRDEESCTGACAEKVLGGCRGVVVSDGYSGCNILSETTRAGYWARARRKWVETMPEDTTKENALAGKGLEYCNQLSEAERINWKNCRIQHAGSGAGFFPTPLLMNTTRLAVHHIQSGRQAEKVNCLLPQPAEVPLRISGSWRS